MLRFFQPEVEVRRPFSAAPLDLRRASSSWDSRVPRMQKDSVFPLPPTSSSSSLVSSLFGGGCAGNDQQQCMASSNASGELERLLGGGFFINADDCDGFHLGTFSTPTSCIRRDTLNCNPAGIGDGLMTSRASADQQHTIAHTRVVAEPRGEKETVMREAKRQKTTLCMKSQQIQPSDETTGSHSRVIKKPVRRSQKLGDKITALQQLVSPFGKTDTASVLHEATIYIKTLHEQIQMLTTPYFGIKSSSNLQWIGGDELSLSQRGLCLSPISPTVINLANQTPLDRCTIERVARGPGVHLR